MAFVIGGKKKDQKTKPGGKAPPRKGGSKTVRMSPAEERRAAEKGAGEGPREARKAPKEAEKREGDSIAENVIAEEETARAQSPKKGEESLKEGEAVKLARKERPKERVLEEEWESTREGEEEGEKGDPGKVGSPRAPQADRPSPAGNSSLQVAVTAQMHPQDRPILLRRTGFDEAKAIKKMQQLPPLGCSSCHIGPECPKFKENYVCAFQDAFRAFPTRDMDAVLGMMAGTLGQNYERLQFGLLAEKLVAGGMANAENTRLSEVVMRQAETLLELQGKLDSTTVRVEVKSSAPLSQGASPVQAAGGILSRLFGGEPERKSPELQENPPVLVLSAEPTTAESGVVSTVSPPVEGMTVQEAAELDSEGLLLRGTTADPRDPPLPEEEGESQGEESSAED